MIANLEQSLLTFIKNNNRRGCTFKDINLSFKMKKQDFEIARAKLKNLKKNGDIIEIKNKFYSCEFLNLKKATVVKLHKTFGFVKQQIDDVEVFIPGKYFRGALVGDVVLIKYIESRGNSLEGEVKKIIDHGSCKFVGQIVEEFGKYKVCSDFIGNNSINIDNTDSFSISASDKVLCEISFRGDRHSSHIAKILENYGYNESANISCECTLNLNNIKLDFDKDILDEAKLISNRPITKADYEERTDLTNQSIFTIDSSDSKDLDDAVSISKMGEYFILGVHIADVSHYIKQDSILDKEAFERGTSIYYADKVIPMLPKDISNGICSLNPMQEKLTISVMMTIDNFGKLTDFKIEKTIIKSLVKGVYSEINSILNLEQDEKINQKYSGLKDNIFNMNELYEILLKNRIDRGSPEIETSESKIVIDDQGKVEEIYPKTRGRSESIIEEFMIMANRTVAGFAKRKNIPFVYRVHEYPDSLKLKSLYTIIKLLGIKSENLSGDSSPKNLSNILNLSRDKPYFKIVNRQVLRSMSKAKYNEVPIGHYGLVLDDYAHFTSPIRRYPDLLIHRILSDYIKLKPIKEIQKNYKDIVVKASISSTRSEINAVKIERKCEDFYKAEYMKKYLGFEFEGIISSVAGHGVYVELENTVEGLVKIENLPKGKYVFDGFIEYKDQLSGNSYKIGDKVLVKCIKTDVNCGKIDFCLIK